MGSAEALAVNRAKLCERIVFSDNPGRELKLIRLEKKLSQRELAKKLGIGASTLADYEANRRPNMGIGFVKRFIKLV